MAVKEALKHNIRGQVKKKFAAMTITQKLDFLMEKNKILMDKNKNLTEKVNFLTEKVDTMSAKVYKKGNHYLC